MGCERQTGELVYRSARHPGYRTDEPVDLIGGSNCRPLIRFRSNGEEAFVRPDDLAAPTQGGAE